MQATADQTAFARTRQRFPPLAASPSLPPPVAPVPRETSPQKGSQSQRDGIVPRSSPSKQVLPRIQKLSLLCTKSLSATSPVLPVPRGGLGGRSRIEFIVSPLPRRRHNESHFAADPPERAFLRRFRVSGFCLRSFARAKNGVNLRRRSRKISVGKTKPDSEPSPLRGRWRRSRRMRCSASARYRA